ncbi:MAG TPA: TonB-dependent receptor, partial [Terriglobales bacterium]|nr:TonB-dependent receptor [Terriglobales bacterium]
MRFTPKRASLLLTALAVFFFAQTSWSQAVYGNIVGTVEDSTGAIVPNAKVTITDVAKGTVNNSTTNESGNFNATHLIPGTYNVKVEAPNFKSTETKDVRVFADQTVRLSPVLAAGGGTETVEVTGEAEQLKTDRADVATLFTERQVEDLPVINRNFTSFQLLTPGTQLLGWSHAASENPQGSAQIFVNGQHFSGTSFQLDGTDNQDPILGIIVINPNLDAVTEAKIATQNYDAEFGQAIAAVVTAQTKSGGNDYHGGGFWFRRNDELRARDPFNQSTKDSVTHKFIPDQLRNQFGGSIGGPVIKNKWFFFGDYQGTREKTGNSVTTTVPTALIRSTCLAAGSATCNLSEYLVPTFPGQNCNVAAPPFCANQLFDPSTGTNGVARTPFVGNLIPTSRLSPGAVKLLSLLPAPNNASTTIYRDNFVGSGTGGFDSDGFDVRSDYNASNNVHVFGRYSLQKFTLSGKGAFDTPTIAVGGPGLGTAGFAGNSSTKNHSLASGFDWTLSNTWITDFRFGYFKYRVKVVPNGVGTSPAKDLGIPGLNVDNFFTSGMPAFFINGGSNTGDSAIGYALDGRLARCNCPLDQNEDQFQFVNNWTHGLGNHSIKFGGDIRYARNLRVPSDQHRAGELSFTNGGTGLSGSATATGVALASLLLGQVNNLHRYVRSSTDAGERQKRWFFYGQDTWRATPKLTVNYGLRWEIYFPQSVTGKDKGGFLDLDTGKVRVAGENGWGLNFKVQNSLTNWAPRLGLAYSLTDRTVIRAGYGRSFDIGVFGSVFGHSVTQNLPVLAVQQVNSAVGGDFASAFLLDSGPPAPVFPAVDSTGQITLPDGIFQRALHKRMQLPTVDAWNLTVQHQITKTMSGEIAYVGNKGTHGFAGNGPAYNINQATVVGFPTLSNNARKKFFPLYGWTQGIDYFGNDASNNYHGLQTKLEKRFANGIQFLT